MINDNIKRYYVLGGLKTQKILTQKRNWKENMKEGIIKKEFNNWLWILTVLSYYVLCELKTQKILTRKKIWICEYVKKEHKKEFNKWLW